MDYYFVKRFRGNTKLYVCGMTAANSLVWHEDVSRAIRMPLSMAAQVAMECVDYYASCELVEENVPCLNMGSAV